ncbi:MAG: hypothetical protein CMJ78_16745 [Planctomycetaceae bacterium]|nr:hypothetical protein [Planctomycetaceae bacterium]
MSELLWLLGQHVLMTSLLALTVVLFCRWRKPSPEVSHLMWLLVLCRLLIPPVATWPWTIPAFWDKDTSAVVSTAFADPEQVVLDVAMNPNEFPERGIRDSRQEYVDVVIANSIPVELPQREQTGHSQWLGFCRPSGLLVR